MCVCVHAHVCEGGGERERVCVCVCVCVCEVTQPRLVYCKLEYFSSTLCICSHFSHPNFTNCKLHTCVLTDADLWQVRVSPIDSGITHKVKKTRVSGPPWRPLLQIHTRIHHGVCHATLFLFRAWTDGKYWLKMYNLNAIVSRFG